MSLSSVVASQRELGKKSFAFFFFAFSHNTRLENCVASLPEESNLLTGFTRQLARFAKQRARSRA